MKSRRGRGAPILVFVLIAFVTLTSQTPLAIAQDESVSGRVAVSRDSAETLGVSPEISPDRRWVAFVNAPYELKGGEENPYYAVTVSGVQLVDVTGEFPPRDVQIEPVNLEIGIYQDVPYALPSLFFGQDNSTLFFVPRDGTTVVVINLETAQVVDEFALPFVRGLRSFSPSGDWWSESYEIYTEGTGAEGLFASDTFTTRGNNPGPTFLSESEIIESYSPDGQTVYAVTTRDGVTALEAGSLGAPARNMRAELPSDFGELISRVLNISPSGRYVVVEGIEERATGFSTVAFFVVDIEIEQVTVTLPSTTVLDVLGFTGDERQLIVGGTFPQEAPQYVQSGVSLISVETGEIDHWRNSPELFYGPRSTEGLSSLVSSGESVAPGNSAVVTIDWETRRFSSHYLDRPFGKSDLSFLTTWQVPGTDEVLVMWESEETYELEGVDDQSSFGTMARRQSFVFERVNPLEIARGTMPNIPGVSLGFDVEGTTGYVLRDDIQALEVWDILALQRTTTFSLHEEFFVAGMPDQPGAQAVTWGRHSGSLPLNENADLAYFLVDNAQLGYQERVSKVFSVNTGSGDIAELATIRGDGISFSPDKFLAYYTVSDQSAGPTRGVREVLDLASGSTRQLPLVDGEAGDLNLMIDRGGDYPLVIQDQGGVVTRDRLTGELIGQIPLPGGEVSLSLEVSPTDNQLFVLATPVSAVEGYLVPVPQLNSLLLTAPLISTSGESRLMEILELPGTEIPSMAFDPTGKILRVVQGKQIVEIDSATFTPIRFALIEGLFPAGFLLDSVIAEPSDTRLWLRMTQEVGGDSTFIPIWLDDLAWTTEWVSTGDMEDLGSLANPDRPTMPEWLLLTVVFLLFLGGLGGWYLRTERRHSFASSPKSEAGKLS